jgi:hypothetical protein
MKWTYYTDSQTVNGASHAFIVNVYRFTDSPSGRIYHQFLGDTRYDARFISVDDARASAVTVAREIWEGR